ncbi:epimerase [Rubrobacter marinus]|uniref:Epimerase n=1 Tax=Rubrobacter marinus TaxID=2653852 RepID=A0A6G8PV34_9ACTN|nr:epimerase [Rubrobacter marinus]QIN78058.1 epimerase [Rubrobacter marinus]
MKLLVLGGGGFLGYHVVAEALAMGHEVSTFNREGEAPVEGAEALQGDRQDDLSALRGRTWDAVLDTFSDPEAVGETARLLSGSVGAYGYVSGISLYHPDGPAVVDEGSPLRRADEGLDDALQERSIAKLRCEEAVRERFSGPVLISRIGIMVGPRDPTDRFSWWPVRLARTLAEGDEVLAPGDENRPVQFSDARDIASWMVRTLEAGGSGTFDAVGPGREVSIAEVLKACRDVAAEGAGVGAGEPEIIWAGEEFLRRNLVGIAEEERPLWFPEDQIPFRAVDSSRAIEAGLRFRSVEETARDTLAWVRSRPQGAELRCGFDPSFERELLRRWRKRPV